MELNEYQDKAITTCMDSCDNFSYMFINLVGEIGEFASKVAKSIRRNECMIGFYVMNELSFQTYCCDDDVVKRNDLELKKEAGDILWQLSGLCKVMGWKLEDIAQMNLDKLASRKQRGVIDGCGDNR